MAWLQSESKLREHPKVQAASADLEISKVQFIGHLHLLWWWVIEYKEKGIIAPYGQIDEKERTKAIANLIARAAEWEGDVLEFYQILVKHAWIDVLENGNVEIHDWNELSGKYSIKKEQAKERQRKFRAKQKSKDEFYNPKQMDMEAEVWDGDVDIIRTDGVQETVSEKNVSEEANLNKRLFASLTSTIRGSWNDMTDNERGKYNHAVGQLAAINADPQEIPVRYKHYVMKYGKTPTPQALLNNWGDLAKQPINLSQKELEKINQQSRQIAQEESLNDWMNE